MLPFGMPVPATVPQRSEILEGLTNYPALSNILCEDTVTITLLHVTTADYTASHMAWKDHALAQASYLSIVFKAI